MTAPRSPQPPSQDGPFRKIGGGSYGTIFGHDGCDIVYKFAKTGDCTALRNDYEKHQRIYQQFEKYAMRDVRIPWCLDWAAQSDIDQEPGLREAAERVDPNCLQPGDAGALVAGLIHPLPGPTRDLLIDKYCPDQIKERARADHTNRDCLVRVYLGSMMGRVRQHSKLFSLRNLPLRLNRFVELKLDFETVACRLGIALAIMHWGAKTDARDVEFVLGSSPSDVIEPTTAAEEPDVDKGNKESEKSEKKDTMYRETELWLLDFNQVRDITMDQAGVDTAVDAWKLNDPYYPRPGGASKEERAAYKEFCRSHLYASKFILEEEGSKTDLDLPRAFLSGIAEVQRERATHQTAE
ncbi:hypothetical protein OQA88_8385 [Cercophora sp. LCS_1]